MDCTILFQFWGKYDNQSHNWHPLILHMIDSGSVSEALWDIGLSESLKNELVQLLHLSSAETRNLLAYWISLHDIGKAGPAFQAKIPERKNELAELGFKFPSIPVTLKGYHGTATTWILRRDLEKQTLPQIKFNSLALALGGHHGDIPTNQEIVDSVYSIFHVGDVDWKNAQDAIINELKSVFQPPDVKLDDLSKQQSNALFTILSGLCTTADWIASNNDFFGYENNFPILDQYKQKAYKQACEALRILGWADWKPQKDLKEFHNIFAFKANTIQQSIIENTKNLTSPFLAIIEAPTGSGKTEAALYLADKTIQKDLLAGFYIAMPTMATSNQMYERTSAYLSSRFPKEKINFHLVHGGALMDDLRSTVKASSVADDNATEKGNIIAEAWFTPRKLTFLAPFGVGTVDQALMGVLNTKHFFLRLFGLSHKLIIFDEVHAYDVYMVGLFKCLLSWLHALGSSVIILSATIPGSTRKDILEAYSSESASIENCKYPRLTIASPQGISINNLGDYPGNQIKLEKITTGKEQLLTLLNQKLAAGGCTAIICNRVKRAQDVFRFLNEMKQTHDIADSEVQLLHARFPYCWRKEIEGSILQKFGKDTSYRPKGRSILVATQIIEQSLDLDFDLMVSDLAPVDLLIQRVGRLHRHSKGSNPPARSPQLLTPTLILSLPEVTENGLPQIGADKYVYQEYILYRTFLLLKDKDRMVLPSDSDAFIDYVYNLEPIPGLSQSAQVQMNKELINFRNRSDIQGVKAQNVLIPEPDRNVFGSVSRILNENDPFTFSVLQATTRDARPSISVVCLIQDGNRIITLDRTSQIDLDKPLKHDAVKACLNSSVSISDFKMRERITQFITIPDFWKDNSYLRFSYPLLFEVHGDTMVSQISGLTLDKQSGLAFANPD